MSELSKLAPRPPFANYDIVVYFGGGLVTLPIVEHFYLKPMNFAIRQPLMASGNTFVDTTLGVLIFLFLSYLIGHGLAYGSGQVIQKFADNIFGKTSGVIIWESLTQDSNRNSRTRELIRGHIKEAFKRHNWFANGFRGIFHLPLIPVYILIYYVGIFGYYGSRVPQSIIDIIRKKLAALDLPEIPVVHRGFWFKPLEHYVMNNNPTATSRMYNYLVIFGLFRSLAFIFMLIIWLQIYYDIHHFLDGHLKLTPIISDGQRDMPKWQLYIFLYLNYFIALFSFLKFQRRYVEEAMFAFALTKEKQSESN